MEHPPDDVNNCDDLDLVAVSQANAANHKEYEFEQDLVYGRSDYVFNDSEDSEEEEEEDGQNPNEPPILKAAQRGNLTLVEELLRHDPSCVNVADDDGYTPLHRAAQSNRIEVLKCLIENGAQIDARTVDGWQAIHSAAQWGHVRILLILVAMGADINARTNGGNSPFHLAVTRPTNRQLIEYMLFLDEVDLEAVNDANDTAYDICKRNSRLYKLWELL
ncbi:PREDICTED: ankyrin repeat domain-containing protein 49-like [Rhagoletis zephyria]|uniref:ankyrin repeat domain-containing protein 49-like n=1 Tax=Rhagoletis zephyria TaxID=28612 RepID=UPI000811A5CA|nr:PREDICTED: ankyrin repeat domain-containing protein 49-like [Rhagoletis zephyria]KAH9389032.1 Ankyrin repeat domain 49 [Tyrophagus putrescentiae]